jgi:hypothetical protein
MIIAQLTGCLAGNAVPMENTLNQNTPNPKSIMEKLWREAPKRNSLPKHSEGAFWCERLDAYLEPYTPPAPCERKEIWRLLEAGEKFREGDEAMQYFGKWVRVAGRVFPPELIEGVTFRRRESVPTASWPAPRYDDPAKCGEPDRPIFCWGRTGPYVSIMARMWPQGAAWLEQPPAPTPQKSPAEQAWDLDISVAHDDSAVSKCIRAGFLKGFESAQKEAAK